MGCRGVGPCRADTSPARRGTWIYSQCHEETGKVSPPGDGTKSVPGMAIEDTSIDQDDEDEVDGGGYGCEEIGTFDIGGISSLDLGLDLGHP